MDDKEIDYFFSYIKMNIACALILMMLLSACTSQTNSEQEGEDEVASENQIRFESGSFDPEKPTIVFFGGGNCVNSWDGTESWDNAETNGQAWFEKANVISLHSYVKDKETTDEAPTYFEVSKLVVDTLLALSKNYDKNVQACGFSTGGSPALDLALHTTHGNKQLPFQISNVTLMDSPCYDYSERIDSLLSIPNPPLIVNLIGGLFSEFDRKPYPGVLNVDVIKGHDEVFWWYVNSLTNSSANTFNNGITGGAYLSVAGKGANIQVDASRDKVEYYFQWSLSNGNFEFLDESKYPKKLATPEYN